MTERPPGFAPPRYDQAQHRGPIAPKPLIYAGAALMALSLATAMFVGHTGIGAKRNEIAATDTVRHLQFTDETEGALGVFDVNANKLVLIMQPGEEGFIRTALKALYFDRKKIGAPIDAPFNLVRTIDQELILEDPLTDKNIRLKAFGPVNAAQFEQLLEI